MNKTKLALIDNCSTLLLNNKKKVEVANQIKSEISGLLNTEGGCILFDC